MQWSTLVGTALGVIVGIGSELINDILRWRREQQKYQRSIRQEIYAEFLSTLTDVHEKMRAASQSGYESAAVRSVEIRDLFRDCYRIRYQISIIAEQGVVNGSEATFRKMRDIRDLLSEGENLESADCQKLRTEWGALLRQLQHSMRLELGIRKVELSGGS
jgi:hypothetical protein